MNPWWSKIELKINPLLWIKSSPVDIYWCLRCLNDYNDVPNIIGSFASGAYASIVAKLKTKIFPHLAQSIESK